MIGTAARFSAWAVATLKWKASSMYSGVVISKGNGTAPPTLLTTMSRRPNSRRAMVASSAIAARSERSHGTVTARRSNAATWWATSSRSDAVREASTTCAPHSARARTLAAPMPRPEPVMIATWSSIRKRSMITVTPKDVARVLECLARRRVRFGGFSRGRTRVGRPRRAASAGGAHRTRRNARESSVPRGATPQGVPSEVRSCRRR